MQDLLLTVGAIILLVVVIAVAFGLSNKRHANAGRARAEQIIDLMETIGRGSSRPEIADELYSLVQQGPISLPQFLEPGGWFDRSKGTLSALLGGGSSHLADWFFVCFAPSFCDGSRSGVLQWLSDMTNAHMNDQRVLDVLASIEERLSFALSQAEADWLYGRALDVLQASRGAVPSRAFALRVGRMRYSRSRGELRPTIYDEEAIANDIAARVA